MENSSNNWHPFNENDFPLEHGSEKERPILVKFKNIPNQDVVIKGIFKYRDGEPFFFHYIDGPNPDGSIAVWTPFKKGSHIIAWSPLNENENENDTSTL